MQCICFVHYFYPISRHFVLVVSFIFGGADLRCDGHTLVTMARPRLYTTPEAKAKADRAKWKKHYDGYAKFLRFGIDLIHINLETGHPSAAELA